MTPSLLRWPEPKQILNQVRHGAAQVAAVLDQAALQIQREREASQPRTTLLLLPELLRNALASVALAIGFAALARRSGSERSLLQVLQSGWRRSRFGGSGRRTSSADADYLRQLGRRDLDSCGHV